MGREDAGRVVGAIEIDHVASGALDHDVEVPHPVGLVPARRVAEVELERVRRRARLAQAKRREPARDTTDGESEPAGSCCRAILVARRSDRDVRHVGLERDDVAKRGVVWEPIGREVRLGASASSTTMAGAF